MATDVTVSNWGGETLKDIYQSGYAQMRNDNTEVVTHVNQWLFNKDGDWQAFKDTDFSWSKLLIGAGAGAALGWMLDDSDYKGYGKTLSYYDCETDAIVDPGKSGSGGSKTTSTVVGSALGALLGYLSTPSQEVQLTPSAGRDVYLAQLQYKQALDQVGANALGQIAIQIAIENYLASKQRDLVRSIADDQAAIANRQLLMAEKEYCRYERIFAPCEDSTMEAACSDPPYTPQYELHMGRARNDTARAYQKVIAALPKKFSRYCTGANADLIRQTYESMAQTEVDAVNHAWRYEERLKWERDDVQFKRKVDMFNVGNKVQASAQAQINEGVQELSQANMLQLQGMSGFNAATAASFDKFAGYLFAAGQNARNTGYGILGASAARTLDDGSVGSNAPGANSIYRG